MDAPCYCSCGRCNCLIWKIEKAGPSGCGVVTAAELKALDEKKPEQARSSKEILALMERNRNYNPGECQWVGVKLRSIDHLRMSDRRPD